MPYPKRLVHPVVWLTSNLGRILAYFGEEAVEAFPEGCDPHDQLIPVSDFGSWLRNLRLRKGLQQVQLGKLLGVSKVSIHRYERNLSKPRARILEKLLNKFGLVDDTFLRRYLNNGSA